MSELVLLLLLILLLPLPLLPAGTASWYCQLVLLLFSWH
jgi:hypothetical protein